MGVYEWEGSPEGHHLYGTVCSLDRTRLRPSTDPRKGEDGSKVTTEEAQGCFTGARPTN